jgi:hypothetical protein
MESAGEQHKTEGGLLKPMIFGGLDGILTSFAIVAGAAGGNLSSGVVLILGFSNIFADALSMGVGEFLSSKAESEWILSERRREEWELENYPEGEMKEMVELYMLKGMSREDAETVITTMAKYKDFFVDVMMAQELELQVPDDDHVKESFKEGTLLLYGLIDCGRLYSSSIYTGSVFVNELGFQIAHHFQFFNLAQNNNRCDYVLFICLLRSVTTFGICIVPICFPWYDRR